MSMTHFDDLAQQLREQLVSNLKAAGALQSPALAHAFSVVPREAFVPCFYQQDETARIMQWGQICREQIANDVYLGLVYQDESLVTKLDQRRWPISSSSKPSVMAKMLEALDVQPDHRVLEIGTGTGYNAALLSTLTGDPLHVVTIDTDETLTETAAQALGTVVGLGVSVITGDGFFGYRAAGPYDRIIVTASVPTIPLALVKQLRDGGKMVMDLQGPLASGFLVLTKHATETSGHFLAESLHFMPLFSDELPSQQMPRLADLRPLHSFPLPPNHLFPAVLENRDFRWFLQWYIPGCQIVRKKVRPRNAETFVTTISVGNPDAERASVVQFTGQTEMEWQVSTYGIENLWNELVSIYDIFERIGKPPVSAYQVMIENGAVRLSVHTLEFPV